MVFWPARLALLAVPKTGSRALAAAYGAHADLLIRDPPQSRHMTLARFEQQVLPLLPASGRSGLEVAAVIREPVDWLGSWYRYRTRPALAGTDRSTAHISFSEFVEAWLADEPPPFARVGRQSRFCARADGNVGVTHLFAHAAMPDLLDFLGCRTGHRVEPGRRNVSPEMPLDLPIPLRRRLECEAEAEFSLYERAQAARVTA